MICGDVARVDLVIKTFPKPSLGVVLERVVASWSLMCGLFYFCAVSVRMLCFPCVYRLLLLRTSYSSTVVVPGVLLLLAMVPSLSVIARGAGGRVTSSHPNTTRIIDCFLDHQLVS